MSSNPTLESLYFPFYCNLFKIAFTSCRLAIFYARKQFEDSFIYVSLQSLSGFRSSNDENTYTSMFVWILYICSFCLK